MMDPIQRTQDLIGQSGEKPASPENPNGQKKFITPSPIPGLPKGKDVTLNHGTTIPITILESQQGLGIDVGKGQKVLLDIGPGVNLLFLDGKLLVRANAISFLGWPFLIVLGTICLAVLMMVYFKVNNQATTTPPTENQAVAAPRTTPIVTQAHNAANNLGKPTQNEVKKKTLTEAANNALPIMDDQDFVRPYDDPTELYALIADKDEAIKVYEEAVQLRKTAAREGNDPYRMRQASIRLRALLSQSKLPYTYQRHAAKQLWVIYHCHWQNSRLAKEALALLNKYNKKASAAEKVIVACPKDDE